MLAGDILPAINSVQQRQEIFDRICSVEHVIPSLHLLSEDSKYLEGPVKILKQLLPNLSHHSVSQSFAMHNNHQTTMKIQTGEFSFREREAPSVSFAVWASYSQLILAAFRHFPFMGGPNPRKHRGEQCTLEVGDQEHWWHEVSSLASELGYRKLTQRYPDRKAADMRITRDFYRRVRPPKYYKIDTETERRKVLLISQIIGDEPRMEPPTGPAEMVSDVEDCGWDLANRCGMPYTHSFQEDVDSLFFDNIYSKHYTSSKRYLTSFGIKRDMFHAFFGDMPDDLSGTVNGTTPRERGSAYPPHRGNDGGTDLARALVPQPRPPLSIPQIIEHFAPRASSRPARRDSNFTAESQYTSVSLPSPSSSSAAMRSPINFTEFSVGPWLRQDAECEQRPSSMYVFGQQDPEVDVTLATASRLFSRRRNKLEVPTFTVLSPTTNGRFRKRQADPQDKLSMVSALRLPSDSYFMTRDNGKRLKMAGPSTILEEARLQRLDTVISVPQNRVPELIHQFENEEESEEEL